ncbi:glycosyltransferase family 4 protein [Alienimonas chondri]|uniref:D-inositol-3-phosphate glycosyltransferase n=1 Tax=Alienimonas chondri TaxID=2681879 RepID=A0ABX1VAF9_9PLAN|nr:glycosyltransferase family 4 protein [Alienimonas chondri]NNJ24862.1 D-inositol-3-phosphate glycosyltransferase [Alienimonas chondri]
MTSTAAPAVSAAAPAPEKSGGRPPRRLLYIATNYGALSETFVSDLVADLAGRDWEVTVVCSDAVPNVVPPPGVALKAVRFAQLTSATDRLAGKLERTFRGASDWPRLMRSAARALGPAIAEARPDVAYVDDGRAASLAVGPLTAANVPFAVHFHGSDVTTSLADDAYRRSLPAVFDGAGALVTASHHMRRLLVLEGADPERCRVIRLAVRTDGVEPVPWAERRTQPPSVAYFGRLTAKKHPVALIEAFAIARRAVPNARLTMIGDGPERDRVVHRIKRLGLSDAVRLSPGVPRAEGLVTVAGHWVFAQHSVTAVSGDQEGFALSPAEAALLELPIVSTWHNGIPEHVADGETGLLVREHDYEAMGERLAELLADPDRCEAMGRAGRERVSALCPPNARGEAIDALLSELADQGGAG